MFRFNALLNTYSGIIRELLSGVSGAYPSVTPVTTPYLGVTGAGVSGESGAGVLGKSIFGGFRSKSRFKHGVGSLLTQCEVRVAELVQKKSKQCN